ncbi:hypothetical protein JTB14_018903 [Gonioctena quinquepunctata]|nr:hypothetical protein JTB14_018903 [Gonioctena quinquepunctata]
MGTETVLRHFKNIWIFWTICCTLSWIATGLLIHSSWKDFQNNAISFVVETSYLDWNTNFPSVVVCETDNQENIARVTDKTFGDPHDYNLDEMVKELVYYKGLSFYTLQICGPDVLNRTDNCFLRNVSYFPDELYSFGKQEVPSLTSLANDILQISPHIRFQRYFAIKEIENQPQVKDVSVEQRKCRFPEESMGIDVHRFYSYSSCCVQCRKEAQLQKCGCVHHLMPNTTFEQHCTMEGLQCLNTHYNQIAVLKASWANRSGLVCGCLPSCTEIELSIVRDDKSGIGQDYAIVELSLEKLPTEMFKRNIVRGKLDLVGSQKPAIDREADSPDLRRGAKCLLMSIETRHLALEESVASGSRPRSKDSESQQEIKILGRG